MKAEAKIMLLRILILLAAFVVAWLVCGCASNYQLGSLRQDMWNGDKALWHDQKFQNERIQNLEKRVYHLERGELLDYPQKILRREGPEATLCTPRAVPLSVPRGDL